MIRKLMVTVEADASSERWTSPGPRHICAGRFLAASLVGPLLVGVAGCSSTAPDDGALAYDDTDFGSEGVDSTDAEAVPGDDEGTSDGGGETGLPEDDEESGGDDSAGDDAESPAPGDAPMCPTPLPDGWIFCEDFEQMEDPTAVFFEYQDGGGTFVLDPRLGASGTHSLRADYLQGFEAAGWLSVAFGRNPIIYDERPLHSPGEDFDEVYWRFRVRTQPGWPDVGPHRLTRATSFAHSDWGQSMIASLGSEGSGVTLGADAMSCVTGDAVDCAVYNDAVNLKNTAHLTGMAPLFSADWSGEWHCVEVHVRLNTPGQVDGVYEFWVDGGLEAKADALDWRGSWSEYGINLVAIENFWAGGAPSDLSRWVDDLVIATSPIGCE